MASSDAGLSPLIARIHARESQSTPDDMAELVIQLQQVVKLLQEQKVCGAILCS